MIYVFYHYGANKNLGIIEHKLISQVSCEVEDFFGKIMQFAAI